MQKRAAYYSGHSAVSEGADAAHIKVSDWTDTTLGAAYRVEWLTQTVVINVTKHLGTKSMSRYLKHSLCCSQNMCFG